MALTTTVVGLGWMSPAAPAQPTAAAQPTASTSTAPGSTAPASNASRTTTTTKARTTTTVARLATSTTATSTTATSTTTTVVAASATTFPPALLAIANSVKRTPASNTSALLAALAPLEQLGYTAQQAEIIGMGQFPLAGPAFYTDNWLEPRPGPIPKLHYGEDVVAAMGTPIRSPVDGILKYDTSDPQGYGLAADVTGPDKTFYVNGHLSATVIGLRTGSTVKQGQVIGFVGSSGDSTGPHDHFEVHPLGGAGVDPKPILDAWQAEAIKAIPELIRSIKGTPDSTVATLPPLQIVLPAPQSAFFPPLPISSPTSKGPPGSLAGLALVGLLALLSTSGLAVTRFRPWPGARVWGLTASRGGPLAGRPRPAR